MNGSTHGHRDYGLIVGLLAGTVVGAGLVLWLAPRSGGELRDRVAGSARNLAARAAERRQQVARQVTGVVEDVTRKGQDVRDRVAGAVAHGAHEGERAATAAKSGRTAEAPALPR